MTRSASSQSRPAGSTCGGMPTQHGCPGGMTPRAPNVVSTGAVRRSASATTSSARSRAPAPAQIRIRSAASISGYGSPRSVWSGAYPAHSPSSSDTPPAAGRSGPPGTSAPARREQRRRQPGQVLRVGDHVDESCHRPEHVGLAGGLVQDAAVHAVAPQRRRDVGRDHEDRRARRPRLADRAERVGGTRAGRRQRDAEPPGRAGVPVRGIRGRLLVAHADQPDRRRAQRLPQREVVDPGQAEAHLDAGVLELRDDDLGTGGHGGILPAQP